MTIEKYGKFKSSGKSKTKKQIILIHSGRYLEEYLNGLSFRYNGKYNRIPNYVVSKEGEVLTTLENSEYSKIFEENSINKNSIIICLENLGWLNKEPLKDYYVNWIGDIYNGKVVDKKWRDYFFWHPYTEPQLHSTALLCKKILSETKINKDVVGHNTKINGIEKFEGIVTRSNFDIESTDLSPAFDFELFSKIINDEQ
jgi:hypothetical protein